jgi:quercetin dioxygenase-like cupin family protein
MPDADELFSQGPAQPELSNSSTDRLSARSRPLVPWCAICCLSLRAGNYSGERAEEASMSDTSVLKVKSQFSPRGRMGQKYLASGLHLSMRLWQEEAAGQPKPETARDYETVGYVLEGRAELHIERQMVLLEPGDSWVVPKGTKHTYKILEPFTAVEATSPPAEVHGRDED